MLHLLRKFNYFLADFADLIADPLRQLGWMTYSRSPGWA